MNKEEFDNILYDAVSNCNHNPVDAYFNAHQHIKTWMLNEAYTNMHNWYNNWRIASESSIAEAKRITAVFNLPCYAAIYCYPMIDAYLENFQLASQQFNNVWNTSLNGTLLDYLGTQESFDFQELTEQLQDQLSIDFNLNFYNHYSIQNISFGFFTSSNSQNIEPEEPIIDLTFN